VKLVILSAAGAHEVKFRRSRRTPTSLLRRGCPILARSVGFQSRMQREIPNEKKVVGAKAEVRSLGTRRGTKFPIFTSSKLLFRLHGLLFATRCAPRRYSFEGAKPSGT
jgi:hypothetical protein